MKWLPGIKWAVFFLAVCCLAGKAADYVTRPVEVVEAVEQSVEVVEEYQFREVTEMVEEPAPVFLGEFTATAYCPCVKCCGVWSADHPSRGDDYIQRTASGTVPAEGRTIAADWSVLPEGSEVSINGSVYTVEDTGSGITGNRIDVYFNDHQTACEWGVQTVEIWEV